MEKITVMVIDDHPTFREGLASLLRDEPDIEVVSTLEDGTKAVETAQTLKPHIAVLDVAMPGVNGIEVAKQIRQVSPSTAILILSAFNYPSYIMASLRAGVAGYLTKDTPLDKIVGAIRMIHSGGSVFDLKVAGKILNRMAQGKISPEPHLHARELQILNLAAQGSTNKDIGKKLGISERTVQTHLVHIFHKLEVNTRTEAVLRSLKEGWVNLEDVNLSKD